MNKRFGKKRVPGCECTWNFTCRKCLDTITPSMTKESLRECPSCKDEAEEAWENNKCRIRCKMCGLSTGSLLSFGSARAVWNALPRE